MTGTLIDVIDAALCHPDTLKRIAAALADGDRVEAGIIIRQEVKEAIAAHESEPSSEELAQAFRDVYAHNTKADCDAFGARLRGAM